MTTKQPQAEMFDSLTEDGRVRIERVISVLGAALKNIGRLPLRSLVESTWLRLGGPACYSELDLQDAAQAFSLLENLDNGVSLDDIETQLEKLFAAPASMENPDVHLMTIHKAKGLEFNTVILPGLGRGVRADDKTLLRWLEHPKYDLMLAPIPPLLSDAREATYDAIGHIQKARTSLETVRLLYVATTRAKSNLYLLGHVTEDSKGEHKPLSGSLLDVLWPACKEDFLQHLLKFHEDAPSNHVHQKLRRLHPTWSLPQMPETLTNVSAKTQTASAGHYTEEGIHSRTVEEGRVVGTIVHEYLDLIARTGVTEWSEESVFSEGVTISNRLGLSGVPYVRLNQCTRVISECLINILNSQRGRWLLEKHNDGACELPVNGVIDGQLIHATIDRTFVDNETCWIVDYKTSSPANGQSPEEFMKEEAARYCQQLQVYVRLMSEMTSQQTIKAALYFPRFDGWREVDVSAG